MEAPPSTPQVEWGLVVPNVPGLQPFLKLVGTGSLGCTSSCLRVLKRRKVIWKARGAKILRMDSDSLLM